MIVQRLMAAVLLAAVLAGCADDAPTGGSGDGPPGVDATDTTGGIRGVVVDQAVVPLEGVTVELVDTDDQVTTKADGSFVFTGLAPNTYVVRASHPFYSTVQQTTVVEAGVEDPPMLRIQIQRVIFEEPKMIPYSFQGYIFCSANVPVGYSEECGEGVGYPCELPPTIFSCGDRIGKNPSNKPGQEWFVESQGMETFIVEQTWDPSIEISADSSGKFRTFVSENWVCDPFCGEDYAFNGNSGTVSGPPMYIRIDMDDHPSFEYNATTRFTTFTYAGDNPGVLLEQPYELFVHTFHLLPAPEGWSIVNGDDDPFRN